MSESCSCEVCAGRALMEKVKGEAEKRIRDEFQAKYGAFLKCSTCGAAVFPNKDHLGSSERCRLCGGEMLPHGYADARK